MVAKENLNRRLLNESKSEEEEEVVEEVETEEENSSLSDHKSSEHPNSEEPSIEHSSYEHPTGENSQIRGDMIKCKNLGIRESVRWQVPGENTIYHGGMTRTKRRSIKRLVCKEMRIITTGLSRYPQMERVFKDYDLGWTTKRGESFFPILVREFYANYQATLENMCKKGQKATDMPNIDKISVRGVND
ncbi:hypothetical protein BC332_25539 [Capsicum chinense]|nr:hypothetical protein BC332_25539 [Capsicum chinense]